MSTSNTSNGAQLTCYRATGCNSSGGSTNAQPGSCKTYSSDTKSGITCYYSISTTGASDCTTTKPSVTDSSCHAFSTGTDTRGNTVYYSISTPTKPSTTYSEDCTLSQSCEDTSGCTETSQVCGCGGTQTRTGSRSGTQSRAGTRTKTRTVTCNANGAGWSEGSWGQYGNCTSTENWGECSYGACSYSEWSECTGATCSDGYTCQGGKCQYTAMCTNASSLNCSAGQYVYAGASGSSSGSGSSSSSNILVTQCGVMNNSSSCNSCCTGYCKSIYSSQYSNCMSGCMQYCITGSCSGCTGGSSGSSSGSDVNGCSTTTCSCQDLPSTSPAITSVGSIYPVGSVTPYTSTSQSGSLYYNPLNQCKALGGRFMASPEEARAYAASLYSNLNSSTCNSIQSNGGFCFGAPSNCNNSQVSGTRLTCMSYNLTVSGSCSCYKSGSSSSRYSCSGSNNGITFLCVVTECGAGEYFANGECQTCPAGYYCPGEGVKTKCPGGKYSTTTGATSSSVCSYCPAGQWPSSDGTSCVACPAGYYCPGNGVETGCPEHTYSTTTGATSSSVCKTCPAGTYNDRTGRTSCYSCDAGRYCPGDGDKYYCLKGTYSTGGAASCTACPSGTVTDGYNSSSSDCKSVCYSNGNCGSGQYCAIEDADDYSPRDMRGTCKSSSATSVSIPGLGTGVYSANRMSWESAKNWCALQGRSMVSLSQFCYKRNSSSRYTISEILSGSPTCYFSANTTSDGGNLADGSRDFWLADNNGSRYAYYSDFSHDLYTWCYDCLNNALCY